MTSYAERVIGQVEWLEEMLLSIADPPSLRGQRLVATDTLRLSQDRELEPLALRRRYDEGSKP